VELCQKKQKRCEAQEQEEAGDMWDHTAIAADSKLVVSVVVGKRIPELTRALVHDAKSRLRSGYLPAIFTDAYDGYETAILAAFGRRYPRPRHGGRGGSPNPLIRWPQGLAYGQVKKSYKRGQVERVDVRVIRGKARRTHVLYLPGYKQINTSVVERHNGTSRLRNRRKVRKTLTFSKARRYPCWMSWLSGTLYNFCRAHGSWKVTQDTQVNQRSPAMAAGLANYIWTTREWFLCPILGG
jgi:IS1 family transposase